MSLSGKGLLSWPHCGGPAMRSRKADCGSSWRQADCAGGPADALEISFILPHASPNLQSIQWSVCMPGWLAGCLAPKTSPPGAQPAGVETGPPGAMVFLSESLDRGPETQGPSNTSIRAG
ncbi:unnamed protein product [Lota lota]